MLRRLTPDLSNAIEHLLTACDARIARGAIQRDQPLAERTLNQASIALALMKIRLLTAQIRSEGDREW